jgi:hypothetical protein
MKGRWKVVLAALGSLTLLTNARPLRAQDASMMSKHSTLWVDEKTGQVFIRPGRGREPMTFGADEQEIERRVEEKTQDRVRAVVAETQAQERADNAATQKQLEQIKPAWTSYVANFQNKFRIGALAYLDYGLYTHTGFGPQFTENLNPPGPYNNIFNSFDISRVYLNTYFTPTEDWTFRFTPELYRANGGTGNANSDATGANTRFASNLDSNLNVRMKYAYAQYKGLLDVIPELKGGNTTFGAQGNPFIPWEEDLYQFRYVNLVPWNYLSLSSSQIGLQFDGPIKLPGSELQYADYGVGVYDNGNFHSQEQSNTKQVMLKTTIYPLGSAFKYQGLGLTGFWNYGWGNVAPDVGSIVVPCSAASGPTCGSKSSAHFERIAAVLHYATEQWNIAGEFDYGQNAFTLGNLYSGSGPADAFGTATGPAKTTPFAGNACSPAKPCYGFTDTWGPQVAGYTAMLNNGRARELGWDVFGHFHIPGSKLTAFGMFQWFLPNDNVNKNPLDFQRFVVGLSYQYNEYLRFAFDSQNLLFYHSQFSMPTSYLAKFNYLPGSAFNGRSLPKSGFIPNMVPLDMHAFFLNMEFAY